MHAMKKKLPYQSLPTVSFHESRVIIFFTISLLVKRNNNLKRSAQFDIVEKLFENDSQWKELASIGFKTENNVLLFCNFNW